VGTGGLAVSVHSVIVRDGVKLDNRPLSVLEVASKTVAAAERLEKHVGRQDNLEVAACADPETYVEQSVSKLDGGRCFNEKNGIQITGGHSTPRGNATTERGKGALTKVNGTLQSKDRIEAQPKGPRPVFFVGMLDVMNRPVPFFRLPRVAPLRASTGRSLQTPSVERPTISDREF
jgi:hypothetical protein